MTTDMPDRFSILDPDDPFEMFAGPLYRKNDGGGMVYGFRVRPEHANAGGSIHGGMLMTFGDFAICSAAIHEQLGESPVTVSMASEFMAPVAVGDLVIATCEVMRRTRSLAFVRADLTVGDERVFACSGVIRRIRRDG